MGKNLPCRRLQAQPGKLASRKQELEEGGIPRMYPSMGWLCKYQPKRDPFENESRCYSEGRVGINSRYKPALSWETRTDGHSTLQKGIILLSSFSRLWAFLRYGKLGSSPEIPGRQLSGTTQNGALASCNYNLLGVICKIWNGRQCLRKLHRQDVNSNHPLKDGRIFKTSSESRDSPWAVRCYQEASFW